jgi:hypothetical protein
VISRSQENVDELATELTSDGITAAGYAANVRDGDALAAALARAGDELGTIEVLEVQPDTAEGVPAAGAGDHDRGPGRRGGVLDLRPRLRGRAGVAGHGLPRPRHGAVRQRRQRGQAESEGRGYLDRRSVISDALSECICLIARTSPADWGITAFSTWSLAKLRDHLPDEGPGESRMSGVGAAGGPVHVVVPGLAEREGADQADQAERGEEDAEREPAEGSRDRGRDQGRDRGPRTPAML